ncbi:hypothetical protein ACF1BQ_012935 [Bradyrhizobium sp. RDT10]
MEPVHLQIAGLTGVMLFAAISLGGVIWQSQVAPVLAVDPRVSQLQSQLETLTKETAEKSAATALDLSKTKQALEEKTRELEKANAASTAAASAKPASPKIVIQPKRESLLASGRFYSRTEKEQIADALNAIQAVFGGVGMQTAWEAEEVTNKAGGRLTSSQLDALIERMNTAKTGADQVDRELERIRGNQATERLVTDLLANKPVAFSRFRDAIGEFLNTLQVYRNLSPTAGENANALEQTLGSEKRNLQRAKHYFGVWMQDCEKLIQSTRMEMKE